MSQREIRIKRGLMGLVNTGNTCYMNSAVQVLVRDLMMISVLLKGARQNLEILCSNAPKIFRENPEFDPEKVTTIPHDLKIKLRRADYTPDILTPEERLIIFNSTFTGALTQLMNEILNTTPTHAVTAVYPDTFRKLFLASQNFFDNEHHHDAEEAYSLIVDAIREELGVKKTIIFKLTPALSSYGERQGQLTDAYKAATDPAEKQAIKRAYIELTRSNPEHQILMKGYKAIQEHYMVSHSAFAKISIGFTRSSLTCPDPSCRNISSKFEAFHSLPLPMPYGRAGCSVYDCLDQHFAKEVLDGGEDGGWECGRCGNHVQATKQLSIWDPPARLMIQFKRFDFVAGRKDDRIIQYPLKGLDLSEYVDEIRMRENPAAPPCCRYNLTAVIGHQGSIDHGHYYSICRFRPRTTSSEPPQPEEWYCFNDSHVSPSHDPGYAITRGAYLLFYTREDITSR